MKLELNAIAKLAGVNLREAVATRRHAPLFDEEIHIEEELINLKESIALYHTASETLDGYPRIKRNMAEERRAILRHAIGMLERMRRGMDLPREYGQDELMLSVTKLVRILVDEAARVNKQIEDEVLEILKPYLSFRQRMQMREWRSIDVRVYINFIRNKIQQLLPFGRTA